MTKAELIKELTTYLTENLNKKAVEAGLEEISEVVNGQTGTLGASPVMPTFFLAVPSRTVIDADFVSYHVQIGIAVPAPTPEQSEEACDKWEDILEDMLRHDCDLGGMGHIDSSDAIESSFAPAFGFVTLEFDLEVDQHGK